MTEAQEIFKTLFLENYQQLCNYAFKFLGDRNECEDAVQDVLIRFWELKKDKLGDHALKYYLYTATRNKCISMLRKRMHLQDIDELAPFAADDDPYDGNYPQHCAGKLVERAFEGLPPKCLEIFKLSRLENLSYKQIADKLDISVKTVENQMGKAIKHMRKFAAENPVFLLALIYYVRFHGIDIGVLSEIAF
ncbi:RNA polymerase sigma-70 factor (ECF subfamily) [Chitinophaga polysaccharea]|uniref:RNA polymerase sigma-70 factor (ECF subfamily) n=1 Tax=Chitinophaga polysaccharea TaxID=1293035 RepID=A0A561PXW1_9BACT|nr:RNA polymerase sigma-70 factor [Chitinophaga polysaccharea]TWF42950.1 RNA polymerase sigma-70 factor (ECF subfamily) [Chitinophaga polysaccharea]